MTTTKRIVSIFLAALFVLTAFGSALTASAASSPITYREAAAAVEITGCDKAATGVIEIPAEINGKPVTSISNWAFSNCKSITGIVIPDSVTNIGDWAFLNCKLLTDIDLPASLKTVGMGAFRACVKLTAIEIPASLTSLSANAFDGCSLLSSVSFAADSKLGVIGMEAFLNCVSLASITLPAKVYSIGEKAFAGCTSLSKITLSDAITNIGTAAFDATTVIYCAYESKAHTFANNTGAAHVVTDTFYAIYKADGEVVAEIPYSFAAGTPTLNAPVVPHKAGYTGEWENASLREGGMVINAVYTVKTAFAVFMADADIVAELPYTVESAAVEEPEVPAKEGYTGRWQSYTLDGNTVEIRAIYTPDESTATFMADGVLVGTVIYNTNTTVITVPNVPEKEGYFGTWESFTLVNGGITVNARYIEIVADSIFITASKNTVEYGESVQLSAKILPYNALVQTVVWESSDDSILKIEVDPSDSTKCTVTHVEPGDATITVTVLNAQGEKTDITGTLNITAGEFSIGQQISNRILGFFAKVMSFMNLLATLAMGK